MHNLQNVMLPRIAMAYQLILDMLEQLKARKILVKIMSNCFLNAIAGKTLSLVQMRYSRDDWQRCCCDALANRFEVVIRRMKLD